MNFNLLPMRALAPLLGLVLAASAQAQTIDWQTQNSLANSTENVIYKSRLDPAGNIVTMGVAVRNGSGPLDGLVQKYSPAGALIWQSWIAMDKFQAKDFGISAAGDIIVCGYNQLEDLLRPAVFKLNTLGNPVWAFQELEGTSAGIVVHADGSFVTVSSQATDSEGGSIVTRLYDSNHNVLWVRSFNGPDNVIGDFGVGVSEDAAGNIYVAGTSYKETAGSSIRLIKYSPTGTRLWTRTYSGPKGSGRGSAVIARPGGGCVITGTTSEWLVNDTADIFTVAVDAAGVQLWTKTFDGAAHHTERFRDMAMDSSGGVALAVFSPGADLHPYAVVLRYGSSGVTLMKKQWRAGNDTEVSAIACAADGSVFVSGQYYGETLSHAFVLKYTNSYQFAWAYKHPGGGKDSAFFGVLTDADSNAIAGGWAKASASLNKTLLMRLH